MKKFLMNCKERLANKKGMTLIEILIVLVIFAIIAAFSIPAYLGFVEDARNKAYIAEARTCYVAAQVIATEKFATTEGATAADVAKYVSVTASAANTEKTNQRFIDMVGSDIFTADSSIDITTTLEDDGSVDKVVYAREVGTKTVTITIEAGGKGAEVVVTE